MDREEPWLSNSPHDEIAGLPDYGFRLRLDHEFNEPCKPFFLPRWHQIPPFLGLSVRYAWTWLKSYRRGKKMFIDNFNMCPWRPIYGAPIGGIGCGTIGRGFKGEFCRFQMVPGMYTYNVVEANQFIVCIRRNGKTVYQQVLSPNQPKGEALSAWHWGFPGYCAWYQALYPRAWTVYELPGQNVRLICRQVSPVIPHDYKDSSIPSAVFVWEIENNNSHPVDVSIMFTFKNGQGDPVEDKSGGVWTESFEHQRVKGQKVSGVMLHQQFKNMPCTYALAAKQKPGVKVTKKLTFDPAGLGHDLWSDLCDDGDLHCDDDGSIPTEVGEERGCAVCARCHVAGNNSSQVEFSLSWDMPVIHFGAAQHKYHRRYARFFGHAGNASPNIAAYSLDTFPEWEEKIDVWQNSVLQTSLPSWYKSALFNELYFVSDGGTVWVDPAVVNNSRKRSVDTTDLHPLLQEYGRFAYLEGQEYRMYNTYDVHHYASFALLMLWPQLQLSIQYDIAAAISLEQPKKVKYCMSGEVGVTKAANAVPHDIGDPDDEPWVKYNAYIIHPTQEWKDLNTKFVLQVFRDFAETGSRSYLMDMYPHVKAVMESSLRWDVDDDGIIDNGGFADQTYDAWSVTGASAYCGGMWLAALHMFCEMAKELRQKEDQTKFREILLKARQSFEDKLWNGSYYNYDSSEDHHHDSVMADQLAGHWFLKASNVPDDAVFPKDHVQKALGTIFKCNVLPFRNGTMGAINGMKPNGKRDTTSIQAEEFWAGVIYGLAATMIQEGMIEEGFQTAYGAYHTCYERYGLGFQTPEAYFDDCRYRSLGYMRPLSIWAMQYALQKFHPKFLEVS